MDKLQRMFKRKIKGKELEGLAKIFDVDLGQVFRGYNGWSYCNIYAQLNTIPKEDSLLLEAYFHSKQFHVPVNDHDKYKKRDGFCFQKTIEIPYDKLKTGIETDEGEKN